MTASISEYLTPQQRLTALAKATRTRQKRAEFKKSIKAGERTPVEAIRYAAKTTSLKNMKVQEILRAIPRVGQVKSEQILREAGVSLCKTAGGLQTPQKNRLIEVLKTW